MISGTAIFAGQDERGIYLWLVTDADDPRVVGKEWVMLPSDQPRAIDAAYKYRSHMGSIEILIDSPDDQYLRPAWEGWAK